MTQQVTIHAMQIERTVRIVGNSLAATQRDVDKNVAVSTVP